MEKQTKNKKTISERIFNLLQDGREITRQDIAAALKISMPTTLQNITFMLETGVIEECGAAESNGGRKARKIRLRPDAGWALGINIAMRYVELVSVDFLGKVKCTQTIPLIFRDAPDWYDLLQNAIEKFIQEKFTAPILGAAVSFPGTLDNSDYISSHIFQLSHMNVGRFRRVIDVPMIFENDANCACRAERRTEQDSYFYLSLNETVGGAIMINGLLFTGDTFQAGEIGHVLLHPGEKLCYCGKRGCADAYLSPNILGETKLFFQRLHMGDIEAKRQWEKYTDDLAILLTNLRMLYNMDLIIGGEVGGYLAPEISLVCEKAARYDLFARDIDYIYPCACTKYACAIGAATLALDSFSNLVLAKSLGELSIL